MSDPFLQDPPAPRNRFRSDRALRLAIERVLPPDVFADAAPEIDAMAERSVTEFRDLAERAERNPPRHVPYDGWGRRVDRIDVDPAWIRLVEIGQEAGIVATPYEDRFGAHARSVQFALLAFYEGASATADCPLSMTDAACRVLLNEDPALAARYVPAMTERRAGALTSGQWMTEKQGGSDVGRSGTVARPAGDGTYALHGTKWFTSATTTDIALTLARPEGAEDGSRGLSLFLIELRRDGGWNGLTVRRLKDKMGTKALPTAEMDLDGTVAIPVGGIGRGVAKIAPMLNITRVHAAFGSLSGMGAGLDLARDYASKRHAFGRALADLPAHRGWIAEITAVYEAGLALGFRAAQSVGAAERGEGDALLARLLTPLTKMSVCRQAVWATSNLIESFGGAGYVEDTGLPRMLRDAHVNCIWEGTTSVLALDVMRVLAKDADAMSTYRDEVERAVRAYDHPLLDAPQHAVAAALAELGRIEPGEGTARRLAWGMAMTLQAALLTEAAGWALDKRGDERTARAAALFCSRPLVGAEPPLDDEALGDLAFGSFEP